EARRTLGARSHERLMQEQDDIERGDLGLFARTRKGIARLAVRAANVATWCRFLNQVQLPPWGPDDKMVYGLLNGTHDGLAYVFSALVAGHILFALYHGFIARDGVVSRMWLRGP